MATVNQINAALAKSAVNTTLVQEGDTCYFVGTSLRVSANNLNEMTLPRWIETAKNALRAEKAPTTRPDPKEHLKQLRYQLQDARRTGDHEEAKELEEAIKDLLKENPKLTAAATTTDSLAKADIIQGVLTKQLHIDTMVDEADGDFVLIQMPHPVPLPSIIIAMNKGNLTLVKSSSRQKIKHGSDVVLSYSIPSLQARVLIFLDEYGSVSVMGVL